MTHSPTALNDNSFSRRAYQDEAEYLPYAAAARYLIRTYLPVYWKNDFNDANFVNMELNLSRYLLMPTNSETARTIKLKWIARELNVSPLLLRNDPDLPF